MMWGWGATRVKVPQRRLKGIRALSLEETPAEAAGRALLSPTHRAQGLGVKIQLLICPHKHILETKT